MLSTVFAAHGLIAFLGWWLLHVIAWRIFSPRRDLRLACLLFGILPAVVFLVVLFSPGREAGLSAAGIFFLLSVNYLILYPALQASSPTVSILCLLRENPDGLSLDEIFRRVDLPSLQSDRVVDLKATGLITGCSGSWALTARGARLSALFAFYRRSLGLREGGG